MSTPSLVELSPRCRRYWKGGLDRYVVTEGGCWIWLGSKDGKGYGHAWDEQRHRVGKAHRLMYERERGPIPEGEQLDHLCRVHACINPAHLEPVTGVENVRRGAGWGGVLSLPIACCKRGHAYIQHVDRGCRECVLEFRREWARRNYAVKSASILKKRRRRYANDPDYRERALRANRERKARS